VYFVRSADSWALVDTGVTGCAPQISAAAAALFGPGSRPAAILITHSHPDHVGSAAELARTWGRPVYLHPDEFPMVLGDVDVFRRNTFPLDRWLILPLLRLGGTKRIEAIASRDGLCDLARVLEVGAPDDESARVPHGASGAADSAPRAEGAIGQAHRALQVAGDAGARGPVPGIPGWQAIPTPGHTVGHVAFFRPEDRVLLSGDAVVTRPGPLASLLGRDPGLALSPWYFTWDRAAARESAVKLAALEPRVIAGGHGRPLRGPHLAEELRTLAAG
jgi:glyoxylase-like metal-dependent hydrolase (beta-lactamase superfamily II)